MIKTKVKGSAMGAARRRKLAGIYPVQDRRPWHIARVRPSLMPDNEVKNILAMMDRQLLSPQFMAKITGALEEDDLMSGTPIERARVISLLLLEEGLLEVEYRTRDGIVDAVRFVPSMRMATEANIPGLFASLDQLPSGLPTRRH